MTTRRMMIAVAAVAVVLGGVAAMEELDRRTDLFRKEAEYHRVREELWASEANDLESRVRNTPMAPKARKDAIEKVQAYRRMSRYP